MGLRLRRGLLVLAVGGVVGLVAAIGAAWLGLPALAARALEHRLEAQGFVGARVDDVRLGLGRARIGSIWLDADGANRVGPIELSYTLAGALEGHVDAVVVDDATLRAAVDDQGVSIAGLALGGNGTGNAYVALPVGRIELGAARVVVESDAGTSDFSLIDVNVGLGAGTMTAEGAFGLRHDGVAMARLGGRFDAALADSISVTLDITDGEATSVGARAMGLAGWLVLARSGAVDEIAGELAAKRVELPVATLTEATVVVDGAPSSLTFVARAGGPAGATASIDAVLDLLAPGMGRVAATLDVPDLAAAGAPISGRLRVAGDGTLGFDAAGHVPRFGGRVRLNLADAMIPGHADNVFVAADLDVSATPHEALVAPHGPVIIEGRWTGATSATLAPMVDGALVLAIDTPVKFEHDATGTTLTTTAGEVVLDAADGHRARLGIAHAVVAFDSDFAFQRVERLSYTLDLPALDLGPVRLGGATLRGDVAGGFDAWSGRVEFDGEGRIELDAPVVRVGPMTVSVRGRFATHGQSVDFSSTDCVALTAPEFRVGPAVFRPTNKLCIMSIPEAEFLRVDPERGVSLGFRVLPFLADVLPVESGAFPGLAVTTPKIRVRLDIGADGTLGALRLNLGGGSLAVPDLAGGFALVEADAEGSAGGPIAFRLRGDVKHTAERPFVVPLGLDLKGTALPGGAIEAEGALRGGSGALTLDVSARHDLALGAGFARLRLHPLSFMPGVRAPAQMFPVLADLIEQASGTVEAEANLTWTATRPPDGQARLALRDVAVTAAGVAAEAVNGVLAFDGLAPPSLAAGQTIAIGLLDIGVPLVNGVIDFGLSRDRVLSVERAEWRWAEGLIFAEPFEADLKREEWQATLAAVDLDLGAILAVADVDGLTGTGTLAGRLPLRLGLAMVAIEDGALETTGPGTLRYAPTPGADVLDTGQVGTDLLLDALGNFHYDSLAMSIDGVAGGETTVGLRLVGSNPDLYDGYPVALNVNLSGALDTLLRRGLAGYRIPDTIGERLEEFGKEVP